MRSKKKRLRRKVREDLLANLRPMTAADLVKLVMAAEALKEVRANRQMDILPNAPLFFQVDQSPEAQAHYNAIDEGLAPKEKP